MAKEDKFESVRHQLVLLTALGRPDVRPGLADDRRGVRCTIHLEPTTSREIDPVLGEGYPQLFGQETNEVAFCLSLLRTIAWGRSVAVCDGGRELRPSVLCGKVTDPTVRPLSPYEERLGRQIPARLIDRLLVGIVPEQSIGDLTIGQSRGALHQFHNPLNEGRHEQSLLHSRLFPLDYPADLWPMWRF